MITNIQVLRAFAALNVVFLHVISTAESYGQKASIFSFLGDWGISGVDIFFVISGFIMFYTQNISPKTPSKFIYGRFKRIIPIYWLLTLCILFIYIIAPLQLRSLSVNVENLVFSLLFISRWMGEENPILFVGWTLEYEMLFYTIFAVSLFVNQAWLRGIIVHGTLMALVIFIGTDMIVLEFSLGILCAYLYFKFNRYYLLSSLSIIISVIILVAQIFIEYDVHRFYIYGIPSFFLVYGLSSIKQTKSNFLIYIGDASYSIYLVQVLTIPAFYKVTSKIIPEANGDFLALSCLASTALFGCLVFQFVERNLVPKRKFGRAESA